MRSRKSKLRSLRRSVLELSDPMGIRPEKQFGETFYSRMLLDDILLHLVPYDESVSVSLEPVNPDVEDLIAEAFAMRHHSHSLLGALRELFREVTQLALQFGNAFYEIVYYSDPETEEIVSFDLALIIPSTLRRDGSEWVQTISEERATRLGVSPQIQLPADRVVQITFPRGIRDRFERVVRDLDALGPDRSLAISMAMPGATNPIGFDFKEWHRCHNTAVAEAARTLGWDARSTFAGETTEFYDVHRFLRFERFKLDLRAALVSQVNDLLRIVGDRLRFSARIVISGFPSSAQIDQSEKDLEVGSASFSEIRRPYRGF